MTKCLECETSLEGQHVYVDPDGPFEPGDPIPRDGVEETIVAAYIRCPGCGSERPCTAMEWNRNQYPEDYNNGRPEYL